MLFVSTAEDFANPLGELISTEQPLSLNYLAFAVNPLGLYCIEPRALGRQQTWHYPDPMAAGFDTAVVGADPASDLMAFMPACVVPDEKQSLLAPLSKPVAAPRKKLRGYGAHGSAIHEPQPSLLKLRQVKPVAGESLRLGIVLFRFFLKKAYRLCGIRPGTQSRSLEARKPSLVLEAQSPLWMALGEEDLPVSSPLSEKTPRVKHECGVHLRSQGVLGGSRPLHHRVCGIKKASNGLCVFSEVISSLISVLGLRLCCACRLHDDRWGALALNVDAAARSFLTLSNPEQRNLRR